MNISIRQALSNVASTKYDKTNIFYYFLFQIGMVIISTLMNNEHCDLRLKCILTLLYLFIFITCFGITITAINKCANREKDIFPNPFTDILSFAKIGGWLALGLFANYTILTIITCIIFTIFTIIGILCMGINSLSGGVNVSNMSALSWILLIIIILFLIVYFIFVFIFFSCIHFRYIIKPEIGSLFEYKEAFSIILENKKRFMTLIFKELILLTIFLTMILLIIIPVNSGLALANIPNYKTATFITSNLIATVFLVIASIYFIDLIGQFLKPIVKPEADIDDLYNLV